MTRALLPDDRRARVELRHSLRRSLRKETPPLRWFGSPLEWGLLGTAVALVLAVPFMNASLKARDDLIALRQKLIPSFAADDNLLTGTVAKGQPVSPKPVEPPSRELPVPWKPAPPPRKPNP